MAKWITDVYFHWIRVGAKHEILYKKLSDVWQTVKSVLLVTREAIHHWFSLVTVSRVYITGEPPHEWLNIVIHGKPFIILYVISCAIVVTS